MLNPNEAPEGFVAVECEVGCDGCAFIAEDCRRIACNPSQRNDGYCVIFVKRDGKATANWPYDSEGTPVEVPHA